MFVADGEWPSTRPASSVSSSIARPMSSPLIAPVPKDHPLKFCEMNAAFALNRP
jgi:hypothetical protein